MSRQTLMFNVWIMLLLALPACKGSSGKSETIWHCDDSATGCYCVGKLQPSPDFTKQLCTKQYECCVDHFGAMDSQYELTCQCWNPSEGGPTCESRLPQDPTPFWKRVSRCQ